MAATREDAGTRRASLGNEWRGKLASERATEIATKIAERELAIGEWLKTNAPTAGHDQKHLDEGTEARVYWNYGYMVALRDIRKMLSS